MKLKYLLSICFVLISAIPLFVGLQYLNEQSGRFSRAQFVDHLGSLSMLAKKRIETAIDRIEDNTALIASRTQMRLSLAHWNRTGDASHRERIAKIITDAKLSLPSLRKISVYDERGRLVASSLPVSEAARIDPGQASKPAIALRDADTGIEVLSHRPLALDQGIVGYLQLVFFGDFITDLVRDRTGLGKTGEWLFAVRDDNGDALFAVPLKYDHHAAFSRRVSRDRPDIPITQALLGNEIIMENAPDYRERPVLAATRYVARMDWGLVAKIDEAEVNELVSANSRVIYIAEFVLILLAVAAGIALAIFLSWPVEKLRAQTARVAEGRIEELESVRGWREIVDLAGHFNHVIKVLRQLNESLNDQVRSRTRELESANQQLAEKASVDPLTSLLNRRAFELRFGEEVRRAKRYGHDLAVVMLDLDHFKSINDRYGHASGDRVLERVGKYLRSTLRESDIVARLGGEEFCLVLIECSPQSSRALLERIRLDIEAIEFDADGAGFGITCSLGVTYLDATTTRRETLLEQADQALYEAKNRGRNRIVEYPSGGKVSRLSPPQSRQNPS